MPNLRVVLAMGGIPLRQLTNLRGVKNGIKGWRGYPIPLDASQRGFDDGKNEFEELTEDGKPVVWIVPALSPKRVMESGNKIFDWLCADVGKAVRISKREFRWLPLPETKDTGMRIAFDIETKGFHGEIERISIERN